jgi:hypothetical protein
MHAQLMQHEAAAGLAHYNACEPHLVGRRRMLLTPPPPRCSCQLGRPGREPGAKLPAWQRLQPPRAEDTEPNPGRHAADAAAAAVTKAEAAQRCSVKQMN